MSLVPGVGVEGNQALVSSLCFAARLLTARSLGLSGVAPHPTTSKPFWFCNSRSLRHFAQAMSIQLYPQPRRWCCGIRHVFILALPQQALGRRGGGLPLLEWPKVTGDPGGDRHCSPPTWALHFQQLEFCPSHPSPLYTLLPLFVSPFGIQDAA